VIGPRIPVVAGAGILLGVTLAVFADVLFGPGGRVLSIGDRDLSREFIYWRDFGFDALRHGNLALWNPYVFSGMPFFGGFQSALLYPLNLFHLALPLARATNFCIAAEVLLSGVFMYLWAARRRLHPLACLVSSVVFMFCGGHFLRISAGYLSALSALIWVPLVFLSLDGLFEEGRLAWCLLGAFAVAMQILAGHPQTVFYTAVAAFLYCGFCLARTEKRAALAAGVAAIYVGAAALAAVQLLTGLQASAESVRAGRVPYDFAASFSLAPQQFITFLAPSFFGGATARSYDYWGAGYPWEMVMFVGVAGLALAVYGALRGDPRAQRFSAAMVLLLLLLALGRYTPLFRILYNYVPGFDKFRGTSKFIIQASAFLALLCGVGLDALLRRGINRWKAAVPTLLVGCVLAAAALAIRASASDPQGWWQQTVLGALRGDESYFPYGDSVGAGFLGGAGLRASNALLLSAGTCALLSALLFLSGVSRRFVYGVALLAGVEMLGFARASLPTFDESRTRTPEVERFLSAHPGDYRILVAIQPNAAIGIRKCEIWGEDPGVLRRYAEFMAFTQGQDPDRADQYTVVWRPHPLFKILRFRYAFSLMAQGLRISEWGDRLPQLQLVTQYRVLTRRDAIFAAMQDASFDPRTTVILETQPEPKPVASGRRGTARVVGSSTDWMDIEADLPQPAVLLVTDAYSSGWRARPLAGGNQAHYQVLPADYVLRAIPLGRGHHHLRLEYLPSAFVAGKWISILAGLVYLALAGRHLAGAYRGWRGLTA